MGDQELVEAQEYPVCPADEPASLETLLQVAVTQDLAMEKLEKLIELKERVDREQAAKAFRDAHSRFLAMFSRPIPTDKKGQIGNGYFRYASLGQVETHSTKRMGKVGLSYTYETDWDKNRVACVLTHRDGHKERAEFPLSTEGQKTKAQTTEQQQEAASLTYAKRQAFLAVTGVPVADEDIDAQKLPPVKPEDVQKFKAQWWRWQKSSGHMTDETPEKERRDAFKAFCPHLETYADLKTAWQKLAEATLQKGSSDEGNGNDRTEEHTGDLETEHSGS